MATTPDIYSPSLLRILTFKDGILYLTQPPKGTNFIKPFGLTACVINPTASEWASIWITGRLPWFSFLEAYKLYIPSISTLAISWAYVANNFTNSSSNPEVELAFENSLSILISCSFFIKVLLYQNIS